MTAEGRRRVAAIPGIAVGAIVIGGLFFPRRLSAACRSTALNSDRAIWSFWLASLATSAIAGWDFRDVRGIGLPLVALGSSPGAGWFSITGVRDIMEANSVSSEFGFETEVQIAAYVVLGASTRIAALSLLASLLESPGAEPARGSAGAPAGGSSRQATMILDVPA